MYPEWYGRFSRIVGKDFVVKFIERCIGTVVWAEPDASHKVGEFRNDWLTEAFTKIDYEKEKEMGKLKKGDIIIGSQHKTTGAISIAAEPKVHTNLLTAQQEGERLAKVTTDKKFVVLEVKGVVSVATTIWE
jgi:hypothetical protein